jgi:gliding motility-associated protein GldL
MLNISEIVQSSGWKNFMAKLYGIGASVVIVGALFKIQHYPMASLMLVSGMMTEAIIFFFSAFEPLHEELDWTLVYPELAGMTDPDEIENYRENALSNRGEVPTQKIEDLLAGTGLDQAALTKLNEGLTKLTKTAYNISDIAEASVATKDYLKNMQLASDSLHGLNQSFQQSSSSLNDSVSNLSSSYQQTADIVSKSANEMANHVVKSGDILSQSYEKLTQSISSEFNSISNGGKSFNSNLESLNKNLSAINTVYELQLKETNEQLKNSKDFYSGLNHMITNLKESVEETQKYKSEVSKLSDNLSALNGIYGNMLSAMNYSAKK